MARGFEGYSSASSDSLCSSLSHPIAAENSATKVCTVSVWAMRADSCSSKNSCVAAYIAAMSSAGYGTVFRAGQSSGGRPESMVLRSSAVSFRRPSIAACLAVKSWFCSKVSLKAGFEAWVSEELVFVNLVPQRIPGCGVVKCPGRDDHAQYYNYREKGGVGCPCEFGRHARWRSGCVRTVAHVR